MRWWDYADFAWGALAGATTVAAMWANAALRRARRRLRDNTMPPPDTIEYRNARGIAEWMRRMRERRAGRQDP